MFLFPAGFSTPQKGPLSLASIVLLALASVAPASAALVTGHLGISASPGGSVTVTNSTIVFGNHLFAVGGTPPNSGYFAAPFDSPNFLGTIKDLNSAVQVTGSTFSLPDFMTFLDDPTTFELTQILPGTFSSAQCGLPAAPGQICTPVLPPGFGLSPFNLENNSATQSTASFTVAGIVHNGPDSTHFTGTFSTTFNGQSFQDVLATLARQGSVSSTYSATFDATAIPEPATFAVVGMALIGAGIFGRRRLA